MTRKMMLKVRYDGLMDELAATSKSAKAGCPKAIKRLPIVRAEFKLCEAQLG